MPDRPIPKMLRPLRDVGDTTQDVGYRLVMARDKKMTDEQAKQEYDWMEEARQIAAQCWCDEETKRTVMDTVLAEAVARRIAVWMRTGAQHARNETYWREHAEANAKDAARYRWLRDNVTYRDLGTHSEDKTGQLISPLKRRWYHDTPDLKSNTLDVAIDAELADQEKKDDPWRGSEEA